MPLNVRRFGISWFLVLFVVFAGFAQQAPTSAEVMRERITKAKALIAVRNYNAAIYEMEGIRRETNDPALNNAVQVMLMNCYLEQGDYKRAQSLLAELYTAQKANKPNANYYAVAAQVVKGSRSQMERYKSLGLTINDRNLPIDAVNDLTKMRETVETVITQSKTLGDDKKQTASAMALLEEAISARSNLALDDYDAKRWKNEITDVRENLMNARSVVNAVDDSGVQTAGTLAANTTAPTTTNAAFTTPVSTTPTANTNTNSITENKPKIVETAPKVESPKTEVPKQNETANQMTAKNEPASVSEKAAETKKDTAQQAPNVSNTANTTQVTTRSRRVSSDGNTQTANQTASETSENKTENPIASEAKDNSPMTVGSLIEYATEKVNPVYPQAAKTVRVTGTVRVDLVVDEEGKVEVENTTGPSMLQRAALDAVKKWRFKPFMRDGQPVKAKGYISFNFNL